MAPEYKSSGWTPVNSTNEPGKLAKAAKLCENDKYSVEQRSLVENDGQGCQIEEGYNEEPHAFQERNKHPEDHISSSKATSINTSSGKDNMVEAHTDELLVKNVGAISSKDEDYRKANISQVVTCKKYGVTCYKYGRNDKTFDGTASIEYLLKVGSAFGTEDNAKIERWMRLRSWLVNSASTASGFPLLIASISLINWVK
jgi:hypothetical protein